MMIMETFKQSFIKKNRKGVSPLIALVLGVIITIAIAVVLTGWLQRYSVETIKSAGNATQTVDCGKSIIEISDVYINTTSDDVIVNIKNSGYNDVTLKEVKFYSTNLSSCIINISSSNGFVEQGDTYQAKNSSCELISGNCTNFDKIRATTTCPGKTDVVKKEDNDYSRIVKCYS